MAIEGFKSIQEKNATEEISSCLTTYSENVLATQLPSCMDGLKACTRRILWCVKDYEVSKGMNYVIGAIGDIHTSGDASIYGAIIRLAQDFMVGNPLVHIDGNSGEYDSPGSAAAPRYLKARASEFARDVYFKGIDLHSLPMTPTKDFTRDEPMYLIPKVPMALVLGNLTVGYAYKSHMPTMDFATACDLTMEFAKFYRDNNRDFHKIPSAASVAKYLIPSFPIPNLIKNREELLEAYSRGDFNVAINLEGLLELNGNSITLRSVPYGTDFGGIVSKIQSEIANKNSKYRLTDYIKTAKQFSSDEAEFYIEFKNNLNPFEVLDTLRPLLRVDNKLHPHYNYIKNGEVTTISPRILTYIWFEARYRSVATGLRYKQTALADAITRMEAMLIVCDYMDEVIEIIKTSDDNEKAQDRLCERFQDLTRRQSGIICGLKLTVLTRSSKPDIEKQLEKLRAEMQAVKVAFTKICDTIYNEAQLLKAKYKSESKTRYSDEFIGYVKFSDWGVIQFFDEEDLYSILNTKWNSAVRKTIHIYPAKHQKYLLRNGHVVPMKDPSRHITCEDVICYPSECSGYTLVLGNDGSTAVMDGTVKEVKKNFTLCPISSTFYAIHRNGTIDVDKVGNYSKRKTVSTGASTDLVYGLPHKCKDMVVFHMNTIEPNILRIDRILIDSKNLGKLAARMNGDLHILDIQSIKNKEIYLNIPAECRKQVNIDYLLIRNIKAMFTDSRTSYQLDLRKSGGLSKKLKSSKAVKTLYTLNLGD